MQPDQHIIQKQVLEVFSRGVENNFVFQQEVEQLFKLKLAPEIEKLLDDCCSGNQVIRIDHLFIDVNVMGMSDIEEKVMAEISRQIQQNITGNPDRPDRLAKPVRKRKMELLLFYLEKGYLPWWSSVKNPGEWQQYLSALILTGTEEQEWHLLRALKTPVIRARLLSELTSTQLWILMDQIAPECSTVLAADLSRLKEAIMTPDMAEFENTYQDAVLKSIGQETGTAVYALVVGYMAEVITRLPFEVISLIHLPALRNKELRRTIEQRSAVLAQMIAAAKLRKEKGAAAEEKKSFPLADLIKEDSASISVQEDVLGEDIYISNSGLVIIAPYLPLFFKQLRLLEEDKLTEVAKAISLLHYLVYGTEEYAEFEGVLSKILCGVSMTAVIRRCWLTELEKSMADELLAAVIGHWEVLKNTSVQGLRGSFLQREGRLSLVNKEWKLKVQQESYDLLLAQLPWSISLIKLPWMKNLLKVDWGQ